MNIDGDSLFFDSPIVEGVERHQHSAFSLVKPLRDFPSSLPESGLTQIWEGNGATAGWGWIEQPDVLNLAVSAQHANVADDIRRWFEDEAEGETLQTTVLETEQHLIDVLERHGYRP